MPCFFESLDEAVRDDKKKSRGLAKGMLVGLGAPLAASCLVAYLLYYKVPAKWVIQRELIFVNTLKIASILTLAFHTSSAVAEIPLESKSSNNLGSKYIPIKIYRYTAVYMALVACMLSIHTTILLLT